MTKEELLKDNNEQIRQYSKRLSYLRDRIDLIEKSKREYKNSNNGKDLAVYEEMLSYINLNGYLVISLLDLYVNLKHLILSENEWEKIFFIKNSYLVIHETINKLILSESKKLIEKSIKNDFPSILSELTIISKKIDDFKSTNDYTEIIKIRHNIAGHIDNKLKSYYDKATKLTIEKALVNINAFFEILSNYIKLINKYIEIAEEKK